MKRSGLITIDMETYYDKVFSLQKITTEEYIRSPQFEVIGIGVKVNNEPPQWVSGTHEQIKTWLHENFDWPDSFILAHNTMFDGAILAWHFDVHPHGWLDTLCMARALHGVEVGGSLKALAERYEIGEKGTEVLAAIGKRRVDFTEEELSRYGDYCLNDVELTHKLFRRMSATFPRKELKLIDLTLRMFIEPRLELDAPLLKSHLADTRKKKEDLMALAEADRDVLMSNQKFAELLKDYGVVPPTKVSARTGKETLAMGKSDAEFIALAEHPDDRVQALIAARLGTKSTLEETRTQRFIDIASRGPLPVPIQYYAAHTGRWGGCLVADTEILVYDSTVGVTTKRIVDVLADDLVWDGDEFVSHEGVVFSGYAEVISWDGITGTADHVVFTEAGEISLHSAMQGSHRITAARNPTADDVDAARIAAGNLQA